MPVRQLFNSWIKHVGDVMLLGTTAPNPASFYAILCNTNTIARTMSIADVVATELAASNGYARQQITFTSGTYDATDQRYELPNVNISFAASGGSLQFQTMVILADAVVTRGSTTGRLVGFATEDAPVTILTGQTQPFIIPFITLNTGYVAGV